MLALSDAKYQIIPDQFSLLLGGNWATGLAFLPLRAADSVLPAIAITADCPGWSVPVESFGENKRL
jgi:hypothetical protein